MNGHYGYYTSLVYRQNPDIDFIQGHTRLYIIDGTTNINNGTKYGQDFHEYVQSLLYSNNRRILKIIQDLLEEMKKTAKKKI
jgi:hypothetical protein